MPEKLTATERAAALAELTGWNEVEGRDAITKLFEFRDFSQAFAFMTRIGMVAEQMDHHPEWFNVYNKVDVLMATHDANGVTQLDVKMARTMNAYAAEFGAA